MQVSNNRIKDIKNGKVRFSYQDRRNGNVEKELTLPVEQFIRRFFLHVRGQQPADVRRRLSVIP